MWLHRRMTNSARRRIRGAAGAAAALLAMAACGSSSKPAAATLSKDYCDGVARYVEGTPDTQSATPEEVKSGYESFASAQASTTDILKSQAPQEAKADVDALLSFVETARTTGKEDLTAGTKAYGQLVQSSSKGCGWATKAVKAKDFEFQDVPKTVPAGTYAFTFANGGKEDHVFVVARVDDGNTKSIDELLAGGENQDGPPPGITDAGAVYAPGGVTSAGVVDLSKPGRYIFLCPIPSSNGQPHFTLGMKGELTVK